MGTPVVVFRMTFAEKYIGIKHKAQVRLNKQTQASIAEEEGFEPPVPRGTTVFKTAAFDHSATPLNNYLPVNTT